MGNDCVCFFLPCVVVVVGVVKCVTAATNGKNNGNIRSKTYIDIRNWFFSPSLCSLFTQSFGCFLCISTFRFAFYFSIHFIVRFVVAFSALDPSFSVKNGHELSISMWPLYKERNRFHLSFCNSYTSGNLMRVLCAFLPLLSHSSK